MRNETKRTAPPTGQWAGRHAETPRQLTEPSEAHGVCAHQAPRCAALPSLVANDWPACRPSIVRKDALTAGLVESLPRRLIHASEARVLLCLHDSEELFSGQPRPAADLRDEFVPHGPRHLRVRLEPIAHERHASARPAVPRPRADCRPRTGRARRSGWWPARQAPNRWCARFGSPTAGGPARSSRGADPSARLDARRTSESGGMGTAGRR